MLGEKFFFVQGETFAVCLLVCTSLSAIYDDHNDPATSAALVVVEHFQNINNITCCSRNSAQIKYVLQIHIKC